MEACVATVMEGRATHTDRPLVAVHATPPQPVTQRVCYQAVLDGGGRCELECCTLGEYNGLGGQLAVPAAV